MSEEEKKAINNMNKFARVHQDMTIVTAKEMDIVLKLVEKQQKLLEQKDNKINKVKDKMNADKMEQFDDYIIYLIESYLKILEE